MLSLSSWAIIIKSQTSLGLNKQQIFIFFQFWRQDVPGMAGLVSGESSLPGLGTATFSLCSHMERETERRRKREREKWRERDGERER